MLPVYSDGSARGRTADRKPASRKESPSKTKGKGKKKEGGFSCISCLMQTIVFAWFLVGCYYVWNHLYKVRGPQAAGMLGPILLGPGSEYSKLWLAKVEEVSKIWVAMAVVEGYSEKMMGDERFVEGMYVEEAQRLYRDIERRRKRIFEPREEIRGGGRGGGDVGTGNEQEGFDKMGEKPQQEQDGAGGGTEGDAREGGGEEGKGEAGKEGGVKTGDAGGEAEGGGGKGTAGGAGGGEDGGGEVEEEPKQEV